MAELVEIGFGYHECVAAATEMSVVLDFLCEQVAGVDDARDVCDFDCVVLMMFANTIFV